MMVYVESYTRTLELGQLIEVVLLVLSFVNIKYIFCASTANKILISISIIT